MSFAQSSSPNMSQIIGYSAVPVIDVDSRILSNGTATIDGTNVSGKITFSVTGIALGSGKVMTMHFAGDSNYPNGATVTFSASSASFAGILTSLYAVASKTSIELYSNITLGIGTYVGFYQVIGY